MIRCANSEPISPAVEVHYTETFAALNRMRKTLENQNGTQKWPSRRFRAKTGEFSKDFLENRELAGRQGVPKEVFRRLADSFDASPTASSSGACGHDDLAAVFSHSLPDSASSIAMTLRMTLARIRSKHLRTELSVAS